MSESVCASEREKEREGAREREREREGERERGREREIGEIKKKIGEEICIGNSVARQHAVVVLNAITHEKAAPIQP